MSRTHFTACVALLLLACGLACVNLGGGRPSSPVFRMEPRNSGPENYSAWFGSSDGRVLYFGLSPFWTLWWEHDGDPRADLEQAGDHLIGRFDMAEERFLDPLRVRAAESGALSSVWDVLAHSNGRIYYTTYYEQMGWVSRDGRRQGVFGGIGVGFNELYEGPDGTLWVTRYSDAPLDPDGQQYGAVVNLTQDGALLKEIRFDREHDRFRAPKSVAVDPRSGEVWVNADVFFKDGSAQYESIRLSSSGEILAYLPAPPELHFVTFDSAGRGWFAESDKGQLVLRVTRPNRRSLRIPLGRRTPVNFVQDIQISSDGTAVLALWSGRVVLVRLEEQNRFQVRHLWLEPPEDCRPPAGNSLLYTAVPYEGGIYATLFCGPTILSGVNPFSAR